MNTEQKRRGRPPGSGNPMLKLTCMVSGQSRNSNINYLSRKAEKHGVTIDTIVSNYVSKEHLKQFNEMPQWSDDVKALVNRLNGGTRIRRKNNEG